MTTLFNSLLEMSIKSSLVIVAIMLVRLLIIKAPKKFSYLLWSAAAFRLCIPTSFKSIFSIFGIFASKETGDVAKGAGNTVINSNANQLFFGEAISSGENSAPIIENVDFSQVIDNMSDVSQVVSEPITNTQGVTEPIAERFDWEIFFENTLIAVWLIGTAVMLIYGIISYIKICKRMQNAILIEGNIYCSEKISSPFTLGFIKPKIYLPMGLSNEESRCIIDHEKYHIKRFDHITKPFGYILLSVHWFNPFCWLAFNRMSYDMEMSCDEKILSNYGEGGYKIKYTETLLSLASKNRFPAPSPIAFNDGVSAKTRIKHALKWKKPGIWVNILCLVLCFAVLVACGSDAVNFDESDEPENEINVELELIKATANQGNFIDENGNVIYVDDFVPPNYNPLSGTFDTYIEAQTFIDLDGDGKNELVSRFIGGDYLILRHNVEIYGYYMHANSFKSLKTDGTYLNTEIANDNSIYRISFDESNELVQNEVAKGYGYESNGPKEIFRINGEEVSMDEIDAFFEEWHNRSNAVFYSSATVMKVYSSSQTDLDDSVDRIYYEDKEPYELLTFSVNHTVSDVKFFEVGYDNGYKIGEVLFETESLLPGKALCIKTSINEGIGNKGISFKDVTGEEQKFVIHWNGYDGSYLLEEIEKPYLELFAIDIANIDESDYYDIFLDETVTDINYNIVLSTNAGDVKDFKFFSIDNSESIKIDNVLYELNELKQGEKVLIKTYLNDATYNRGFSFVDNKGETRYFVIKVNMQGAGDELAFEEFYLGSNLNEKAKSLYNKFLSGTIPAYDRSDSAGVEEQEFYISDLKSDFDNCEIKKYAFFDLNGDDVDEMVTEGYNYCNIFSVYAVVNNKVVKLYHVDGMDESRVLNNGDIISEITSTGTYYTYTFIDTYMNVTTVTFDTPSQGNDIYYFINEEVSKEEFDKLTKEYFDLAETSAELDWCYVDNSYLNYQNLPNITVKYDLNEDLTDYGATLVFTDENKITATALAIEDEKGNLLQYITFEDEFMFEKIPFPIDVTFDGNTDILIPYYQTGMNGVYYQAFVWNVKQNKYIFASAFSNLSNFTLDHKDKQILSIRRDLNTIGYSQSYYNEEQENFVSNGSLVFEYKQTDDLVVITEYSADEIVNELSIPGEYQDRLDECEDERVKEYFSMGSKWNLSSEKWQYHRYNNLKSIAYRFFEAYITGNIETAKKLMDSPDNPSLSYFSGGEDYYGPMENITHYEFQLINYSYDEENGTATANVDIAFDSGGEGEEGIIYMTLTFVLNDVSNESEIFISNDWQITNYDFEA